MTRTEIEQLVLSVLDSPLIADDKLKAAKAIGSMLFEALGSQVDEDLDVVVRNGRKMRVVSCNGPHVQLEYANGSEGMVVGMVDSLALEISGGRQALAEAISAMDRK